MDLQELEQHWHAFGEQDPLWAILSTPGKRGGAWELDEFFATGRSEVAQVLRSIEKRGISYGRERALDFGCGVGRLTQALSDHFARCDGVDVAASMIEHATRLNRRPERVAFHHNEAPDLTIFGDQSFDFVLSSLVLQHMEPGLMTAYLQEFLRVLRVDGVAYFNIPERIVVPEELPREAWRAKISLNGELPSVVAGQVARVPLLIKNASSVIWPGSAQIEVRDHWLSDAGATLVFDDGRSPLGRTLAPGETCELGLEVTAPETAGTYRLVVDLVQEWVSWFADRGSEVLELTLQVIPSGEETSAGSSFTPTMEMHAMSPEAVRAVIEVAGGTVLDASPSPHSITAHRTIDYIVIRSRATAGKPLPLASIAAVRRSRIELAAMESRADLLGFPLTSRSSRWGRISVLLREALRRVLVEILHRQTEFNSASVAWGRGTERELDDLVQVIDRQRAVIDELQDRVARLEGEARARTEV
jgi:SAM-dependent methyltransferase